jgi:hypothetical protein
MTHYGMTELYRLYDGNQLLYIGISRNYNRHRKHDHSRRYGNDIAENPVIETFQLRFEAELAEVVSQYIERPRDGRYPKTLRGVNQEIDRITGLYAENPERLQSDFQSNIKAQTQLENYLTFDTPQKNKVKNDDPSQWHRDWLQMRANRIEPAGKNQ